MPGHPRLYRRGATYYHRAAIPVDIKDTYPKSEETFSLKTKDHHEALKLVRIEAVRVDALFDDHRRLTERRSRPPLDDLTDEQIKHIGDVYYAHLLDEDEEVRLEAFEGRSFDEYAEDVDDLDEINRHDYARGEPGFFFEDEAEEVLSWENVDLHLAPASPGWRKVIRTLQAASIKASKAKRLRNEGEVIETPQLQVSTPTESNSATTPVASSGPLLSDLVEEWATEKARTSWVPKTEREHRVWKGHFIDLAGDRPLTTYGKEDGRAFKQVLMNLPANWNKHLQLKGLSLSEAADRAKALEMPPMSDSNLNKIIGCVAAFWSWADNNYDDCPDNPFKGLKVKKSKRSVRDERNPFTLDELKAIFAAPVYTGCRSVREWSKPGDIVPRDAGIYWVPLVSLFSGARAGEVIQLYVDDVRQEDGIWYLDVNDDGDDKRLKTAHSHRVVPLHQTLIDLGFLTHVAQRRKQGKQRLFPDLKMGADGYYSSPFSKHFNRFLKAVGIKNRRNAFHSFRHCFEDACRDSDISKEVMDALQGHGEEGMSGRYGRGFVLKKLAEAMSQLRYDGLDLSHLT
ncbi:putative phage integrase [Magnetospira sp. QH-2]|nr:putative phage integrase [Magnetospira sp. QH-2]